MTLNPSVRFTVHYFTRVLVQLVTQCTTAASRRVMGVTIEPSGRCAIFTGTDIHDTTAAIQVVTIRTGATKRSCMHGTINTHSAYAIIAFTNIFHACISIEMVTIATSIAS